MTGIGIAVTGTVLAALFTGDFQRRLELGTNGAVPAAVTVAGLTLTVVAAALVGWGFGRARRGGNGLADTRDQTLHDYRLLWHVMTKCSMVAELSTKVTIC